MVSLLSVCSFRTMEALAEDASIFKRAKNLLKDSKSSPDNSEEKLLKREDSCGRNLRSSKSRHRPHGNRCTRHCRVWLF